MAQEIEKFNTPYFAPTPAYYTGTSYSSLVPYPFPVSIGGHAYQLQWDSNSIGVWGAKFKRNSLPLLRTQADASATPGEQSVSPEQFWRRSQETWTLGEGQTYLDRSSSDSRRYHDGEGINPWESWGITLLNDTQNVKSSSNTGIQAIVANSYVYILDGTAIQYSSDLTSWTTVTHSGTPASPVSLATDGYNIWTARDASCIYTTTTGASTETSYATGKTVNLVRFVKSRLMAAGAGVLYNVTKAGALSGTDILLDLSARNFQWVDICGSPNQIYAAGYSGDKSFIYRTAIKADGTALDVPIVAGQLPDGEIIRSVGEYLGYILLGTDLGVRFCSSNSDGSLIIGSLIKTYDPVYCFEGQDRFVWFGASNYDGKSGLYRLDLTAFTSTLTPAYASDLMGPASGTVRTVATFNGVRIFTVDGFGLYTELANTPVQEGRFVSGVIAYGISDPKVAMFLDLKHEPLNGTVTAAIVADQSDEDITLDTATVIGVSETQGSVSPANSFPCGQLRGENFQIVLSLKPTNNIAPTVSRWTLRSYPAPLRTAQWDVPILLDPTVTAGDKDWSFDVDDEVEFLTSLHRDQAIVTFQVSGNSYQVVMYDYQWLPEAIGENGKPRGTFYAQLREIVG